MFNPRANKPTQSVWHIKSKSNKNWNRSGCFIYKGMRGMPLEVGYKLEELKRDLGEMPEDLEWGFVMGSFKYYLRKISEWFCGWGKFILWLYSRSTTHKE